MSEIQYIKVLWIISLGMHSPIEYIKLYTAISIKVVHEQSGKVEYERKRLLGIALKIH